MLNFVLPNESVEWKSYVSKALRGKENMPASSTFAMSSPLVCVLLALTFGGAVLGFPPTVLKAVQTPFKTPVAGRLTGCCVSVYPPSSLSLLNSFPYFPLFSNITV